MPRSKKPTKGMKQITVYVNIGFGGCKKQKTFEIEEAADEGSIEEVARDVMFNMIEWGYYEKVPSDG